MGYTFGRLPSGRRFINENKAVRILAGLAINGRQHLLIGAVNDGKQDLYNNNIS